MPLLLRFPPPSLAPREAGLQVGLGAPARRPSPRVILVGKLTRPPPGPPSRLWKRTLAMNADRVPAQLGMEALELEQLTHDRTPSSSADGRDASLARVNSSINRLTKWIVLAGVLAVVVWKHDHAVLWAGIGGVVNSGIAKSLKRIIKQERPLSAAHLKADPGMPSSHAQSLGYVALYAAIGYLSFKGLHPGGLAVATGIILLACYMAWLRVAEGLHTPAQVLVGGVAGSFAAGLWLGIWLTVVRALVSSHQWARYGVVGAFVVAGTLMFIFGVRKWRLKDP